MEYICETCNKAAEVFCSCDTSHQYCYRHFVSIHLKARGEHNGIDIATRLEEISQTFISTIESLKKVEKKIISRSNEMVQIIQIITKSKLSCIKKYIDCCTRALKSRKLDIEKLFKDYQNIDTRVLNIENFQQITTQDFSIFKNDHEIIDPDEEFKKTAGEKENKLETEKLKLEKECKRLTDVLNSRLENIENERVSQELKTLEFFNKSVSEELRNQENETRRLQQEFYDDKVKTELKNFEEINKKLLKENEDLKQKMKIILLS